MNAIQDTINSLHDLMRRGFMIETSTVENEINVRVVTVMDLAEIVADMEIAALAAITVPSGAFILPHKDILTEGLNLYDDYLAGRDRETYRPILCEWAESNAMMLIKGLRDALDHINDLASTATEQRCGAVWVCPPDKYPGDENERIGTHICVLPTNHGGPHVEPIYGVRWHESGRYSSDIGEFYPPGTDVTTLSSQVKEAIE